MLDEAYERFVTKKGGEIKQERKRAKRINPDADADLLEVILCQRAGLVQCYAILFSLLQFTIIEGVKFKISISFVLVTIIEVVKF